MRLKSASFFSIEEDCEVTLLDQTNGLCALHMSSACPLFRITSSRAVHVTSCLESVNLVKDLSVEWTNME